MYNTKEGKSCVIYIRVSSERQVKGYSLDGQKHYLAECAERRGMTVLDTYVEEGKSGKSIEGRTEFQRMLDDIQSGKVHTDYVLVFKLSRFGRNARDVLNSLEFIMKYGVHLMCVEDGLDSSTSMGKMMITILGAVAELERENIIAQSLLGREEKAKSGGWNGGFAPYGYRLVKGDDKSKGKLETVPEEKAVVQLVFDMFLNRNMGYTAISGYDRMNAAERRDLVKYLISEVELFPREEQKTQKRFVKAIAYKFPIEQKVLTQFDECGASVETVVLLTRNT